MGADKHLIVKVWTDMVFKQLKKAEPETYRKIIFDYYESHCIESFSDICTKSELDEMFEAQMDLRLEEIKELSKKFNRKQIEIYNLVTMIFLKYFDSIMGE